MEISTLTREIRRCRICTEHLPLGPNPVFQVHPQSKIVIIGQAPGTKVHASGVPFDDASGKELKRWLDVDDATFYDPTCFAIVPMGFCYPGKGKSGDLPPRKECAPQWHQPLFNALSGIHLTLLVGQFAQQYYLGNTMQRNLTETVRNFQKYLPDYLPLVHPSPRNRIWQRKNPWFEKEVVPFLQKRVKELLLVE